MIFVQWPDQIHANDSILTFGYSETVKVFLLEAAKKLDFQVDPYTPLPSHFGSILDIISKLAIHIMTVDLHALSIASLCSGMYYTPSGRSLPRCGLYLCQIILETLQTKVSYWTARASSSYMPCQEYAWHLEHA